MAHFEDERILPEPAVQIDDVQPTLAVEPKGPRKLHKQRAEPAGFEKRIDAVFEVALVLGARVALVRERFVQFGSEPESGIVSDPERPNPSGARVRRPVEARINFDGVEVLSEVSDRVEVLRLVGRIYDPFPVFVRETGRSDTDHFSE